MVTSTSKSKLSLKKILAHLHAIGSRFAEANDREFFQDAALPLCGLLGYAPNEVFLEYGINWRGTYYRVDAAIGPRRDAFPWLLLSTKRTASSAEISRHLHLLEGLADECGANGVLMLERHIISVAVGSAEWHCRLDAINNDFARRLVEQCGRPTLAARIPRVERPHFYLVTETPSGEFTIDRDLLEQRLEAACAAKSNDDKKVHYESLAVSLFEAISCIEIRKQNLLTDTGELDIIGRFRSPRKQTPFWNPGDPYFVIECKNWRSAVTSREIEVFVGKLQKCRASFGVLFSRNGVTGRSGRDAIGNIEAAWRQYGIVVVVVTEEIVRQVVRGWDFYSVLEQLYEAARFSQRGGVDFAKAWT